MDMQKESDSPQYCTLILSRSLLRSKIRDKRFTLANYALATNKDQDPSKWDKPQVFTDNFTPDTLVNYPYLKSFFNFEANKKGIVVSSGDIRTN